MTEAIEEIHEFWFGELDDTGLAAPERNALWFNSSGETDGECRRRFGSRVEDALAGELAAWATRDRGLIALVILLDQFTRNIFRGTPRAFSGDEQALALAQHTIETGHHQRLPAIHQVFLYLPLEHSENPDIQEECVTLFRELADVTGSEQVADNHFITRPGNFGASIQTMTDMDLIASGRAF